MTVGETLTERMQREAARGKALMAERKLKATPQAIGNERHFHLECPGCGTYVEVTEADANDIRSSYRMGRMLQAGRDLRTKSGPYYDKWLASMHKAIHTMEVERE